MNGKKEIKLNRKKVKIFKIRNRSGYAAIYQNNITEGRTADQAFFRMAKAAKRRPKRK
ncbi:MAG: hypothetical protein PHG97_07190 [Candidatus Margulisbacteria bacterium]|nr:hypothetical protein [Candidatus Margulisiibacteriota bacterium]